MIKVIKTCIVILFISYRFLSISLDIYLPKIAIGYYENVKVVDFGNVY